MKKWLLVVLLSMGLAACDKSDTSGADANLGASESTVSSDALLDDEASIETASGDGHNAENSLDTVGIYMIQSAEFTASLSLNDNGQYEFEGKRQKNGKEESFKYAGAYKWMPDGTRIVLGSEAKNVQFFVGENVVVYLGENPEGKNKYTQVQGNPELVKELD